MRERVDKRSREKQGASSAWSRGPSPCRILCQAPPSLVSAALPILGRLPFLNIALPQRGSLHQLKGSLSASCLTVVHISTRQQPYWLHFFLRPYCSHRRAALTEAPGLRPCPSSVRGSARSLTAERVIWVRGSVFSVSPLLWQRKRRQTS